MLKECKLFLVWQSAKQQQPQYFFKHEAVRPDSLIDNIIQVNAPVNQSAMLGNNVSILIPCIALDITDIGQTSQYARTVRIPQTALDAKLFRHFWINKICLPVGIAQDS